MSITSLSFLAAAGLFVVVCWRLPRSWRAAWLLLGSLGFLAAWSWQFVLVLLVLGAVNFVLGQALGKRPGRGLLWSGIALNVLALLLLKYRDFYVPALGGLLEGLGLAVAPGGVGLLVPVGLSFLAVQFIGVLVDVNNGRAEPERNPLAYAVYVFYFPKILAGPIERAREFLPRLENLGRPDGELLRRSLALVLVGLVRKLVFADSLHALLPADLFSGPGSYAAPLLVAWLLAFAFALYNDFAGYTSIVRGLSGLLGVELSVNFRTPYFSRSFNEFWMRWHISLSNWLRDYTFFPLVRALLKRFPDRGHAVHVLVPPVVTMLISGMWHGLSWNMLAWGGLHGFYLVVERLFSLGVRRAPGELPRWRQVLSALLVFGCVLLAWLPFSMGLGAAGQYLHGLAPANWQLAEYKMYVARFLVAHRFAPGEWMPWLFPLLQTAGLLVPALLLDVVQYRDELAFLEWPRGLQAALLAVIVILFALLSLGDAGAPFVYQGF